MTANAERTDRFQIGDSVELNSGGPPMTVYDIGRVTGWLLCQWETTEGKRQEGAFPAVCVRRLVPCI
jgi:uncharacterized protein YodC (DUF2158 family)